MSVKTEYTAVLVFPDADQVKAFKSIKYAPKLKDAKNL